jgi:hypothetical protein
LDASVYFGKRQGVDESINWYNHLFGGLFRRLEYLLVHPKAISHWSTIPKFLYVTDSRALLTSSRLICNISPSYLVLVSIWEISEENVPSLLNNNLTVDSHLSVSLVNGILRSYHIQVLQNINPFLGTIFLKLLDISSVSIWGMPNSGLQFKEMYFPLASSTFGD